MYATSVIWDMALQRVLMCNLSDNGSAQTNVRLTLCDKVIDCLHPLKHVFARAAT